MRIEIMNWDKFNPRRDVKSTSWLRLQNNFWQDHKFFDLDNDGKMIWIAVLSTASQEQKSTITINPELVAAILKVKKQKVESTLQILEQKQCVRITSELRDVDVPTRTDERTDEQTNERTKQTGPSAPHGTAEISPKNLFELWNSSCGPLPKAKTLTSTRRAKAQTQILKCVEYGGVEHWTHVIQKFVQSEFCTSQWRPTFDDLLNEAKRISALEGKYDNRASKNSANQSIREIMGDEL